MAVAFALREISRCRTRGSISGESFRVALGELGRLDAFRLGVADVVSSERPEQTRRHVTMVPAFRRVFF